MRRVRARTGAAIARVLLAATAAMWSPEPVAARGVGTDLAALALCLYGDCEARGSYAADPFGQTNPGVLSYVAHSRYLARGLAGSASYFRVSIGDFEADVGSGVMTGVWDPVVLQVATGYAEGAGGVEELPGLGLRFRTRAVRLALGIDAEAVFGVPGLGLGLAGVVPGTTTDVSLAAGRSTLVRSTESRDLEVVPGFHWHGGEKDWLMVGGVLDVVRNGVTARGVDPGTGRPFEAEGTTNAWFARGGVSVLPFVPIRLGPERSLAARWFDETRLGVDVEYRSLSAPGEGRQRDTIAYFGLETLLLPEGSGPWSRFLTLTLLAGVDTAAGWGIGAGLYGQGPLAFLGCNPAYSSRPLTRAIGDRVGVLAVTCSAWLPL